MFYGWRKTQFKDAATRFQAIFFRLNQNENPMLIMTSNIILTAHKGQNKLINF